MNQSTKIDQTKMEIQQSEMKDIITRFAQSLEDSLRSPNVGPPPKKIAVIPPHRLRKEPDFESLGLELNANQGSQLDLMLSPISHMTIAAEDESVTPSLTRDLTDSCRLFKTLVDGRVPDSAFVTILAEESASSSSSVILSHGDEKRRESCDLSAIPERTSSVLAVNHAIASKPEIVKFKTEPVTHLYDVSRSSDCSKNTSDSKNSMSSTMSEISEEVIVPVNDTGRVFSARAPSRTASIGGDSLKSSDEEREKSPTLSKKSVSTGTMDGDNANLGGLDTVDETPLTSDDTSSSDSHSDTRENKRDAGFRYTHTIPKRSPSRSTLAGEDDGVKMFESKLDAVNEEDRLKKESSESDRNQNLRAEESPLTSDPTADLSANTNVLWKDDETGAEGENKSIARSTRSRGRGGLISRDGMFVPKKSSHSLSQSPSRDSHGQRDTNGKTERSSTDMTDPYGPSIRTDCDLIEPLSRKYSTKSDASTNTDSSQVDMDGEASPGSRGRSSSGLVDSVKKWWSGESSQQPPPSIKEEDCQSIGAGTSGGGPPDDKRNDKRVSFGGGGGKKGGRRSRGRSRSSSAGRRSKIDFIRRNTEATSNPEQFRKTPPPRPDRYSFDNGRSPLEPNDKIDKGFHRRLWHNAPDASSFGCCTRASCRLSGCCCCGGRFRSKSRLEMSCCDRVVLGCTSYDDMCIGTRYNRLKDGMHQGCFDKASDRVGPDRLPDCSYPGVRNGPYDSAFFRIGPKHGQYSRSFPLYNQWVEKTRIEQCVEAMKHMC